jgi:hypothetical protein
MGSTSFSARYTAAMVECGGRCPIEAGVLGRLADHQCRHGRLPFDRTPRAAAGPTKARSCSRCRARSRSRWRVTGPRENPTEIPTMRKENQIMRDIATATLSGNLTRDVELRSLPSGTDVARLRVASGTR